MGVCFKNGFLWRQIALGKVFIPGYVKLMAVEFRAICRLGYAGLLSGLWPWAGMADGLLPLPVNGNDLTSLSGFAFVAGFQWLAGLFRALWLNVSRTERMFLQPSRKGK